MNSPIQFKTTTPLVSNSMNRSPLRSSFVVITLALACFAPSSIVLATDLDGVLPGNNTADGSGVLISLTTGVNNSGFGFQALNHNTSGSYNTAEGFQALWSNVTGLRNTANGSQALRSNTEGTDNTATGLQALFSNTTINGLSGGGNTANGSQALRSNTTGSFNTATGYHALLKNTGGNFNTATGHQALASSTTGTGNTASGVNALVFSTGGSHNAAYGDSALYSNTTGNLNTAVGYQALYRKTTGDYNIAVGNTAGNQLTSGERNIYIGSPGLQSENSTIRIGDGYQTKTFISGIYTGQQGNPSFPVYVNSNGQLGIEQPASSRRYKDAITPMNNLSEGILKLKPVRFVYKGDDKAMPQFGLVAEDVAEVNPDLVVRNDKGEIYTVRYDAVNAMLLNEFLKEHRKVQELESAVVKQQKDFRATAAQQQEEIQALTASLKEQAAQIQKVSAQIEATKPAPQTVLNNQ